MINLRSPRTLRIAPVAGLAAVAMLAAACGSSGGSSTSSGSSKLTASAPGITANSIAIGSTQPLSGVASPGYDEIAPASNAYFQYVNAHGGIYGRKIHYTYLDDQYNPSITVTKVHQLVLTDNIFAFYNGLGPHAPRGRPVPELREGTGRLRRVGLRVLERPEHPAVHLRLAA
jgi:branched-chain amino acid transport system substrate-binding protein